MKMEMVFSGFGGQGALTIGRFVAQAAMDEGKCVSWLPSYGPEMRGGTANVATIVSDKDIASPLVSHPNLLVALNQPSLDKFGPAVPSKGLIIINTDMCPHIEKRDDVEYVLAPMNSIAGKIGSMKIVNMVAIGIIIARTGVIKFESIESALKDFMSDRDQSLLELNLKAIKAGMEL
jgi:2-oxoglutarate ferredoxin oxidoreductase subunit gamma